MVGGQVLDWGSGEGRCIVRAHNELLSPTLQFNLPSRCLGLHSSGLAGSTHTHTRRQAHTRAHTPITPPSLKKTSLRNKRRKAIWWQREMAKEDEREGERQEGREDDTWLCPLHYLHSPPSSLFLYLPPIASLQAQVQRDFRKGPWAFSWKAGEESVPFISLEGHEDSTRCQCSSGLIISGTFWPFDFD